MACAQPLPGHVDDDDNEVIIFIIYCKQTDGDLYILRGVLQARVASLVSPHMRKPLQQRDRCNCKHTEQDIHVLHKQ